MPEIMNKAQLFQDRISFSGPLSLYRKGRYVTISGEAGRAKFV